MRIERNRYLAPLQPIGDYKNVGGGGATKYTDPEIAKLLTVSPVSGTFYTLLNLSSTQGVINRIGLGQSSGGTDDDYQMRVTVDGGTAYTVSADLSTDGLWSFGDGQWYSTGDTLKDGTSKLDFFTNIEFADSILIEVAITATTYNNLQACTWYTTKEKDVSIGTPAQIKLASTRQVNSVNNTWYTILDATGISGVLTKFKAGVEGGAYDESQEVKLTIDGTAKTYTTGGNHNGLLALGTGGSLFSSRMFEWIGQAYFDTSLKLEMRQTSGVNTLELSGIIQYIEVV